ncbi:hypothetical protein LAZ67_3000415 [Cordylochernes scorpioides]|uniref:Uncharacterized protein n=1 Tax=Cordylochernes scorpioides TaxID=51811 RepID=A0ABY6KAV2_9ARAC|nr:hypothetical protein LAZ67_3000415 [Cordylochernes scorpioides]
MLLILYPWIRIPSRVLSAGPAEPRFFRELVTAPPSPFPSGLGTGKVESNPTSECNLLIFILKDPDKELHGEGDFGTSRYPLLPNSLPGCEGNR